MNTAIDIQNLVVDFKTSRGMVRALQGLNLSVELGKIYGFLGPNGAGKTTTLHVLLGFVEATAGVARIFGVDVRHAIARRRIGFLPEHPDTYRFLTGRELLFMAARLFGLSGAAMRRHVDDLLEQVGLTEACDRRMAGYSRGMLQRIGLAQALINDPDLIILDEPTGGFDPVGRISVRRILTGLRARGKTVFFSSHELSEVERVCDCVGILAAGRLVAEGRVADLARAGETLENYFVRITA